jgi:hypothetical protein
MSGAWNPDERTRTFFRAVPVFDRSQVDPLPDREPTPLEPPSEPITGDSHAHLLGPLRALADELGYRVKQREDTGAADGWCDHENKRIGTAAHLAPNVTVRVLVHETIHALGVDCQSYPRAHAEVIVDTTTLVVLGGLGLDVSGEIIP